MDRIFIIFLAIITIIVFNEPGPVWFFPVFLIALMIRKDIRKWMPAKKKISSKYVAFGLAAGLFIEVLAILNSLKLVPEQRALFHPLPVPDLIIAVGYYAVLSIASYLILKKTSFSLKQVFVLGGIFGLIAEQHGAVLLGILAGNILGGIYVFLSYASFLAIPYLIFERDFARRKREKPVFASYPIVLVYWGVAYVIFLAYYIIVSRAF